MDTSVMEPTKAIGARISKEQFEAVVDFIGDEKPSDYVRRLIAEDFARHNQPYPGYEIVDNEMRSKLKIRGRGKP